MTHMIKLYPRSYNYCRVRSCNRKRGRGQISYLNFVFKVFSPASRSFQKTLFLGQNLVIASKMLLNLRLHSLFNYTAFLSLKMHFLYYDVIIPGKKCQYNV